MGGACSNGTTNEEQNREGSSRGKRQSKKKTARITDEEFKDENSVDIDELSHSLASLNVEIMSNGSQQLKRNKYTDSKQPATPKDSGKIKEKGKVISTKFGKALDKISTTMTNFGPSTSYSPVKKKDYKINILCFEVANTILRGSKLMDSLSEEKVRQCKHDVLRSDGVQILISDDMNELLCITALDKKKEWEVFSSEVVRFGNRCKDPQFHNLDCFFAKFRSDLKPQDGLGEIAREGIKTLMNLSQRTCDLYLEIYLLRKFEEDYRKKCEEEENNIISQKGDRAKDIKKQIDNQKSCIKDLKKETLWSKKLEEVVEKLVYIVHFLHLEIHKAFKTEGEDNCTNRPVSNSETLGSAGLALHYANIITKMDNVAVLHKSLPATMKEVLYNSLPQNIKIALKIRLLSYQPTQEEYTVQKIRREIDKTLNWLLPMANYTIKTQQGFGWVSEMTNIRETDDNCSSVPHDLIKLQTLTHAKIEKIDKIIVDLLVLLHRLVKCANLKGSTHSQADNGSTHSRTHNGSTHSQTQSMMPSSSRRFVTASSFIYARKRGRGLSAI